MLVPGGELLRLGPSPKILDEIRLDNFLELEGSPYLIAYFLPVETIRVWAHVSASSVHPTQFVDL